MKRILDILMSVVLLIILGWLILIFVIISGIIHKSNGIYKQARVGKYEKVFTVLKIQSMNVIKGFTSTVTTEYDPRVTRYGNFIRKFKIDELPQIINILNGTMSLVGPRPTVQEDAARMNIRQKKRFNAKPGLTGLAQINGNTALTWPERIEYDLEYITNQSFLLDLKIICKTFLLIISNKAETHPKYDNEWEQ